MAENNRGLSIAHGVALGFERAATNIYNIGQAREKLNLTKKTTDLTNKQRKLEIQKMEHLLSPDQLKLANEKLKTETKAQNAAYNLSILKIEQAEAKGKRELEEHETSMTIINKMFEGEGLDFPPGVSFSKKVGDITVTDGKPQQPTSVDKALGELESGGYTDPFSGDVYPFETRQQAENQAYRRLGIDWQTKYPRAVDIINKKWPKAGDKNIRGSAESRFNELLAEGNSEADAYKKLAEEGF